MNDSLSGSVHIPRSRENPRPRLPASLLAGVALLSAAVGAGTGAGVAVLVDDSGSNANTQAVTQPATTSALPNAASVADLYARLRPSVVKINVTTPLGAGSGSGVILDTGGHIVTNYHVVRDATQLDVKLSDGTITTGTVIGTDPGDDLAIIEIDPGDTRLTPATLADTSQLRIGDNVVAIGNPLELEATVTEGIVSGLGRVLSDGNGRPLRELIQTDTAINPGNSGGGLFDMNGRLIGITNAIENPSGQDAFSGIGYAIPASTLQTYLPEMLAGKTVEHARLGVSLGELTPSIASELGISIDHGVMIGSVQPGSGAANAGLRGAAASQPGDVITAIDGRQVMTYDNLAGYLDTKDPGDTITLTIVRGSDVLDVDVTLDAWTNN